MLEASIKMGLFLETHNLLKVRMVYVRIDTEQTFEYCFHNFSEVWRERRTYKIYLKVEWLKYESQRKIYDTQII